MNYTIEAQKGSVKIDFTVTAEEWEERLNKAYLKNKLRYNVPGFRKGHAPRKMIERMYGEGTFFNYAFDDLFNESYSKVLSEHSEIVPVDNANVELGDIDENGIKFSATVTTKPEVKLGAYKGIKVPAVEYNVTAEDVQAELDRAARQASRKVEVEDREVQKDDIVNLDYSGKVDGVRFDGGTASGQDLTIGSGTFIPGFEDQMIGMKKGETKDLTVTFPAEYHEKSLAGKEAVFTVTVNKISVMETPELNDDFAKDVSKFDTLVEYRAAIEAKLKAENERRATVANDNALIEAVAAGAEVEIPQCMIENEVDDMIREMEMRLSYMYRGMKLDDYLKYTGGTMEELRKARYDEAKHSVRVSLVMEALLKAENITVTDEELDAEIARTAEKTGKSAEEYRKGMDDRTLMYMKNDLISKKLLEFLRANNTLEVTKAEEEKPAAKKPAAKKAEPKKAEAKAKEATDGEPEKKAPAKKSAKKPDNK